jgi:hypothetical protein
LGWKRHGEESLKVIKEREHCWGEREAEQQSVLSADAGAGCLALEAGTTLRDKLVDLLYYSLPLYIVGILCNYFIELLLGLKQLL